GILSYPSATGPQMQREPMVWAVAGMIFGFVLGYMVAGAGGAAAPRAVPVAASSAAAAPGSDTGAGQREAASEPLDPNEPRALESLATRDKSNLQARLELGSLLMEHGRYDEAARWLREALAIRD